MKKLGVVLVCLCLVLGYFIYDSYYHIDIYHYDLKSSKIKSDVRIVMIADVHDDYCRVKDKVIENIQSLNPDLILCVGDIIDNHSTSDSNTLSFLKQLTLISKVYMSLGNHELSYYKNHSHDLNKIKDIGVHLLEEEYEDIYIHGNALRIGGMYNYAYGMNKGSIEKDDMNNNSTYQFLKDMTDTSAFQIMMAHRPDSFVFCEAYKWNIDLVVSGHNHGGQVILPFIGGIYAPEEKWFPHYDYGHFLKENMNIIITRGISSSEILPRIHNPAEIVEISIKPLS